MNLTINNKKLKIKYILGNFQDLATWPTVEDVMFILIQWAMSTEDNSTFSDIFLEKKLGITGDKLKEILTSLEMENYIIREKNTNTKTVYKIVNNPFV